MKILLTRTPIRLASIAFPYDKIIGAMFGSSLSRGSVDRRIAARSLLIHYSMPKKKKAPTSPNSESNVKYRE